MGHIDLPMFRVKVEKRKAEGKEREKILEKNQERSEKIWQFSQLRREERVVLRDMEDEKL